MSTCPNCNKELMDGTVFCDGCGTQIPQTVFCPACGKQTSAAFAYCQECGAPIAQNKAPAKKAPKKNLFFFGGIGVAVIALVVILICVFSGGGEPSYGLYVKDGELVYNDLGGREGFEISSDLSGDESDVTMSDDGKYLFYCDKDSGSIYYREVSNKAGDAVKVDSSISDYQINTDGSLVTYVKEGNLYQRKRGDEKEKIDEKVTAFLTSADGKRILYRGEENWYLKVDGQDKEKICNIKSNPCSLNREFTVFHYIDEEKVLYKKEAGKDKVKIASDVISVYNSIVYESGEFYYAVRKSSEDPSDLYFFDGKEAKKIAGNLYSTKTTSAKTPVIIYETKKPDAEKTELFIAVKGTVTELKQEKNPQGFRMDKSGTVVIYLDDVNDEKNVGDLYRFEISGDKPGEVKKYASEVSASASMGFIEDSKDIYYFKDYKDSKGTLYVNDKKVDDDVTSYYVDFKSANQILYIMDYKNGKGTLKFWDGGSAKKIADDADNDFVYLPDGRALYLLDVGVSGKGDLYLWDGGSKGKKIDEDVSEIVDPQEITRESHMPWTAE